MFIAIDECRTCSQPISLAADGAWVDESGACGCGIDEHSPGGFDQAAADDLARETPWYDDPTDSDEFVPAWEVRGYDADEDFMVRAYRC